jgi:urate oxidase
VGEHSIVGPNRYGKSAVRVFRVDPDGGRVTDLTVDVACTGEFDAVHERGDNSPVLPTDTIKNTVFALAQDRLGHEIERFGEVLATHFLEFPSIDCVAVTIEERPWTPIADHTHAFTATDGERRTARVLAGSAGDRIESGIRGLTVLKTSGSSFVGFPRDRYTTLQEADDRILATELTVEWRYRDPPDDYSALWAAVRAALVDTFAARPSRSAQEQAYLMGDAVLAAQPNIEAVTIGMPNRHHLAVDLNRFGHDDRGIVFQPTTEPYGDIWVTVERG